MRITLVAGFDPEQPAASGVQSYVMTLGRTLAARGEEVEVLSLGSKRSRSGGIEFVPVSPRATSALEFVVALARHLSRRKTSAQVVHANRPDDLIPFHVLSPRVKKVLTLHGDHGVHLRARRGRAPAILYRVGERYSLHRTQSIICVSPRTKEDFSNRYPQLTPQFHVIPPGIDLELFHPRDRLSERQKIGIPESAKVATFVGRFEPEKDPLLIVDQFIRIHESFPDARLLMVGDGRLDSELRRRAISAQGSITIMRPVSQRDLALLLGMSDLLVLASRHEGLPTVALEALASGVPVVGPRVGVLPEVIESGINGFLIQSPLELGTVMQKALYETNWVPAACRASVLVYGWERVAPAILQVYHDIAS